MPRRQSRLPVVVLLASLTISIGAAAVVYVAGHQRDQARFRNATEITRARIENRLQAYVTMLRGVRGLFAASDSVGAREFAAFVRQYELARNYPGVQGIGYAIWVPSSVDRDSLIHAPPPARCRRRIPDLAGLRNRAQGADPLSRADGPAERGGPGLRHVRRARATRRHDAGT